MRIALIVNPTAGRNTGLAAADAAEPVLAAGGWHVTRIVTTAHREAQELARRAAREGYHAIFACGGDGTLSQVLEGLVGTGIPGGCIPTGTGNDFARTIGLSRSPAEAAQQALIGHKVEIDLLDVNGGEAWALNIIGVGFDAAVADRINRRTRLTGGLTAYLTAVAQELVRYQPTHVRLTVNGEVWEGDALLVAVANAKSYGAGMKIAPHAEIADGLLDVVLVKSVGRLAFLRSFPRVLKGTHTDHPAVTMWQGSEARVETPEPVPALIDGELQARTPLHVRIAPRRAKFWMPGGLAPAMHELHLQPSPEA